MKFDPGNAHRRDNQRQCVRWKQIGIQAAIRRHAFYELTRDMRFRCNRSNDKASPFLVATTDDGNLSKVLFFFFHLAESSMIERTGEEGRKKKREKQRRGKPTHTGQRDRDFINCIRENRSEAFLTNLADLGWPRLPRKGGIMLSLRKPRAIIIINPMTDGRLSFCLRVTREFSRSRSKRINISMRM